MLRYTAVARLVTLAIMFTCARGYGQLGETDLTRLSAFLGGEAALKVQKAPKRPVMLFFSQKELCVADLSHGSALGHIFGRYRAPKEVQIVDASFKYSDSGKILILFSDHSSGTIDVPDPSGATVDLAVTRSAASAGVSTPRKIAGDAVYVLGDYLVFASRDTGKTWTRDSLNIGSLTVYDLTVDSLGYAWIATSNGVYHQHPDSSAWQRADSLPSGYQAAFSIFVDRKGRIFASGMHLVVSTDRGTSWQDVSSGVNGTVNTFGDDAYGNVYAATSYGAFRLSSLTPPWTSVGDSIYTARYNPLVSLAINSISGDTLLFAATSFGIFQSSDQGGHWSYSEDGSQFHVANINSVVKSGGSFLVSDNRGIFRASPGDTSWERVFPSSGFVPNLRMVADSAGNVYSRFPVLVNSYTVRYLNFTSTDHGTTWLPDTDGYSGHLYDVASYSHWVDRQGTQYLAGVYIFFSKKTGEPWKLDTLGLHLSSTNVMSISDNNKKGSVYAVTYNFLTSKYTLYRRAVNDSLWSKVNSDTIGTLASRIQSDNEGNVFAFNNVGQMFRYNGSTWTQIPLHQLGYVGPMLSDRNGVLWTEFVNPYTLTVSGVRMTSDDGANWTYVGLDSVTVNSFLADQDTIYAVTAMDGIYGFTASSGPTGVRSPNKGAVRSFELLQNYPNPFNPSTSIEFRIARPQRVRLSIFDLVGREVAVLVNEVRPAGSYRIHWRPADIASGMYFYRLESGSFIETRKLVFLK